MVWKATCKLGYEDDDSRDGTLIGESKGGITQEDAVINSHQT